MAPCPLLHKLLRQDRARGPRRPRPPLGMLRVVSSPVPSRSVCRVALDLGAERALEAATHSNVCPLLCDRPL